MNMRRLNQNGYGPVPQSPNLVEEENEHMVEGLKTKISALKSLSIDIGSEVRDQNSMLRQMDDDFDSTGGFLSSSMGRLKRMAKSGHNRWMLYMILFILFVFFILYLTIKFS